MPVPNAAAKDRDSKINEFVLNFDVKRVVPTDQAVQAPAKPGAPVPAPKAAPAPAKAELPGVEKKA